MAQGGSTKIRLKRERKYNLDSNEISQQNLYFGEPLYVVESGDRYDDSSSSDDYLNYREYLVIGNDKKNGVPDPSDYDSISPVTSSGVVHLVPYKFNNEYVADKQVFYKDRTNYSSEFTATLMDEKTMPMYPATKAKYIMLDDNDTIAGALVYKLNIDKLTEQVPQLGYDSDEQCVYIRTGSDIRKTPDKSDYTEGSLEYVIANKVDIEKESASTNLAMGVTLEGLVYVNVYTEDPVITQEYSAFQEYVDRKLRPIKNDIDIINSKIVNNVYVVGTDVPTDNQRNLLWIDQRFDPTNPNGDNRGLRYYNSTNGHWDHVPVAFT